MATEQEEKLPIFGWRDIRRSILERSATRRIEVFAVGCRFVVQRINPGTYVIERRDNVLFDGRNPAKTAIGTKELKSFILHSAFHDRTV